MKKKLLVMSIIISILLFYPFSHLISSDLPNANPAELWNYITVVSPYTQWQFWADHQGMQPGRAPHGRLHKVYVNDRTLNTLKPPFQYGSIIVKENYSKEKKLMAITVMYKVFEYNPGDGDWFWAKYTPEGKADPYGKPEGCIGCHGARANNDFVIVHEFK